MQKVEVSRDALGFLLIYSQDHGEFKEGDPVGEPRYYKSKRAAASAAQSYNSGAWRLPSKLKEAL